MKTKFLLPLLLLFTGILQAEVNPTILYIGDSHSFGKLGTVIEKKLSSVSQNVIMESSCGSTPNTWLSNNKGYATTVCGFWKKDNSSEIRSKEHRTPKFEDELAIYRPQVTIVQLGTNIAAGDRPNKFTHSIEAMMKAIADEKSICIWIGPPDANSKIVTKEKLTQTNLLLTDLAMKNNCHYIDSLKLTKFPSKDKEGIHYSPDLSAKWGTRVSAQILAILSDKISVE
jgi:hypothetical protein